MSTENIIKFPFKNSSKYIHAVVRHARWLESEVPKSDIIYSQDGETWNYICTCDPEWAQEIVDALNVDHTKEIDNLYYQLNILNVALHLAVGELSANSSYRYLSPDQLVQTYIDQASKSEVDDE